jgi:hypothetical protein
MLCAQDSADESTATVCPIMPAETAQLTARAAPPPSMQPFTRHVLNCLVQNEPGVLSRVSGILAARGFKCASIRSHLARLAC